MDDETRQLLSRVQGYLPRNTQIWNDVMHARGLADPSPRVSCHPTRETFTPDGGWFPDDMRVINHEMGG